MKDWTILDQQAPIPYVRDPYKKAYKVPTVKFEFEREQTRTVIKEVRDAQGQPGGTTTERSTYMKDCKVTLSTFGHSSSEDNEHWLEALITFKKEMALEWEKASSAKANDARVLFEAMNKILLHTANAEWMDCLNRYDQTAARPDLTWEKFKLCVSDFTNRVVFKKDAYDKQKSYLQERAKPFDLTASKWSLRFETLSRYMPWLITSVVNLKKETFDTADWKDWWKLGFFSEAETRRIILNRMPDKWQRMIQLTDTNRELQDRADVATNYTTFSHTRKPRKGRQTWIDKI